VHVDTLIDYTIMNHDVVTPTFTEETTDESPATDADTLLANMAGRSTEGTTGNIRDVEMFLLLNVNLITRVRVAHQTKVNQFQVLLR
jgi:hypothetical protein